MKYTNILDKYYFVIFQVVLINLSKTNPTLINGKLVQEVQKIRHKDVFSIVDRKFRFEFPPGSNFRSPLKKTPGKSPAKFFSPSVS